VELTIKGTLFDLAGNIYWIFVPIRGQRLVLGSCRGLNPRPSDAQPIIPRYILPLMEHPSMTLNKVKKISVTINQIKQESLLELSF